jgi:hypothetical protein
MNTMQRKKELFTQEEMCAPQRIKLQLIENMQKHPTLSSPHNYHSPSNGEIFPVLPRHFLLFPAPAADLPPGVDWRDDDGRRRFSPRFLAGLLRHLGAAAVVALDPVDYDTAPLAAAGLAVWSPEDLGLSEEGREPRPSLQVLKHLVPKYSYR